MTEEFHSTRGAPWDWQPSLQAMCSEVNVEFNKFIEGLANNKADVEMAQDFGVTEKTIMYLREHFEKYGIDSMMGQD